MRVSGLSWNSSGANIAVVHEMERHEDWCDHESLINIWNINRRDFDPSVPQQQIRASNCICIIKFHPKDPSLLVVGGFTGEVAVYNIARENDSLLATSYGITMSGHKEKISSLSWISTSDLREQQMTNLQNHIILSSALDGKIIIWKLDYNKQELIPTKGFQLVHDHFPRSLGVKTRSNTEVGITCLSVNNEDANVFILGTEPGAIFQGSLASMSLITPTSRNDQFLELENGGDWYDPVTSTFASHIGGRIIDIRFSPFHRDVFLSVGSDQEIRIYTLLHPHAPIHVIHVEQTGISCVAWSFSRPMIIVASGQNNRLYFHDLSKKDDKNALEVKATEKTIPFPLTFVEFNGSNSSLVATGDGFGRVHILKLPSNLMSMDHNEIKLLNELSQVPEEEN